jgi:hypothetical protein
MERGRALLARTQLDFSTAANVGVQAVIIEEMKRETQIQQPSAKGGRKISHQGTVLAGGLPATHSLNLNKAIEASLSEMTLI